MRKNSPFRSTTKSHKSPRSREKLVSVLSLSFRAFPRIRIEKGRLEVQVDAGVNVIVRDYGTPLEVALCC